MTQHRTQRRFANLTQAVLEGSVKDVRRMIEEGAHLDDREEANEPTPLMAAASRGRLDIVKTLIDCGADVNAEAEDLSAELDQFSFLDSLYADGRLTALTALAFAAIYGQAHVYKFLYPRTAPRWRKEANALQRAQAEHGRAVPRPFREAPPKSARLANRAALLASRGAARKWVIQCPLCQKQGYKPGMPAEIDRRGTAAEIRKLFSPLILENYLCEQCSARVARAQQKMAIERRKPARVQERQEAESRWVNSQTAAKPSRRSHGDPRRKSETKRK